MIHFSLQFFYFKLYLASKDTTKFEQTLNAVEPMKQEYVNAATSIHKREIVKIFSGFLKVYYYIITGRVSLFPSSLEINKIVFSIVKNMDNIFLDVY